ncbi:hypothetical protein KL86CLO1_12680 [uncultured Eubacteriales bacterium]|uniref:Uncharacterized protein n=1 Tax=uncultured Eubacteriales bacterium TaxID=172733 RepID=A0A212KCW5_9FIRM|nr:hypothetical protein KL86CLO1_12680 [uncultured Eubacteriales bacterium]
MKNGQPINQVAAYSFVPRLRPAVGRGRGTDGK